MNTIKIRMKKNARGSADGIMIREYEAGHTYDLPEALARAFVDDMKVATYAAKPRARNPGERD